MTELLDIVLSVIGGAIVAVMIESIFFIKRERNRRREIAELREFLTRKRSEILNAPPFNGPPPTNTPISGEQHGFLLYREMLREETTLFLKYHNLKPKELYEISSIFTSAKGVIESLGLKNSLPELNPEFYNGGFFKQLEKLEWLNFKINKL